MNEEDELDTRWLREREAETSVEALLEPLIPAEIDVHIVSVRGDCIRRFTTHTVPVDEGVPQLSDLLREGDDILYYDYDISGDELITNESTGEGRLVRCENSRLSLKPKLAGFLAISCIIVLRRREAPKTQKHCKKTERHTRKMKQRF